MEPIDFIAPVHPKDTKLGLTYLFMSFGLDIQKFQEGGDEGFIARPKVPTAKIPEELESLCNEELDVCLVNKERTRFIIASLTKEVFYFIKVFTEKIMGMPTEVSTMKIITYGEIMDAWDQYDALKLKAEMAFRHDTEILDSILKNTVN